MKWVDQLLQFVCVWLSACVRLHAFEQNSSLRDRPIWTQFSLHTDTDPIEIGDLGSKVKVTVNENVSKSDEKNCQNFKCAYL